MVKENEYPLTLGGMSRQRGYRGFDLVVLFRKRVASSVFVIDPKTKNCIWRGRYAFDDEDMLFSHAESFVDSHIGRIERWLDSPPRHDAQFYKVEARMAAMKAFKTAMAVSNISDTLQEDALGFFEAELDTELNNNFKCVQT